MKFSPEQAQELSKPLSASHVKQREQAGRKFSYVEGWHAIAEANRIFGFDAWTRDMVELRLVAERARKMSGGRDGWGVSYLARVRVMVGDGLFRDGIGSGHGIDADLGLAHESAAKEAETDAMKRALMTFGNPFGLALYDKGQANVAKEPTAGERYYEESVAYIREVEDADELGKWWKAEAATRTDILSREQQDAIKRAVAQRGTQLKQKEAA